MEQLDDSNFSVDVWRYDPDIVTGENKAEALSARADVPIEAGEQTVSIEVIPKVVDITWELK